jgi:hypothetical protein
MTRSGIGFSHALAKDVRLDISWRDAQIDGASGDLVTTGHTSRLSVRDGCRHDVRIGVYLTRI